MFQAFIAIACVLLTGALGFAGWLTNAVVGIKSDVASIQAQHVNNGGSTLRDAIDRVEAKVDRLDEKVDDHIEKAAGESVRLAIHLQSHEGGNNHA